MTLLATIILSAVEGITEFLPVSSTGHMILTAHLLSIPQTEFVKSFEIITQLGAICAVVILYGSWLLKHMHMWPKLIVACIPTVITGGFLYTTVKQVLLENVWIPVAALAVGGVVFIALECILKKYFQKTQSLTEMSYRQCLLIGVAQSISIIPGVSRAASSMFGGMLAGLNRQTAVEFSFLLAIPVMSAATGLEILKNGISFSHQDIMFLSIGFVGAFATALIAIKGFLRYIQTHTFIPFGIYRIVLALVFGFFFLT